MDGVMQVRCSADTDWAAWFPDQVLPHLDCSTRTLNEKLDRMSKPIWLPFTSKKNLTSLQSTRSARRHRAERWNQTATQATFACNSPSVAKAERDNAKASLTSQEFQTFNGLAAANRGNFTEVVFTASSFYSHSKHS